MKKIIYLMSIIISLFIFSDSVSADYYTCEDYNGYTLQEDKCVQITDAYSRSGSHWCNDTSIQPKQDKNRWVCEKIIDAKLVKSEQKSNPDSKEKIPDGYELRGAASYRDGTYYCTTSGWVAVGTGCYGPKVEKKQEQKQEQKKEQEDLTYDSTSGETVKFIKEIYGIVKIVIPVLIVLLSIVDFLKVVLMSDEKDYKNAWNKFIKRILIGIVFFVVPALVSLIINISGIDTTQNFLEIFK